MIYFRETSIVLLFILVDYPAVQDEFATVVFISGFSGLTPPIMYRWTELNFMFFGASAGKQNDIGSAYYTR